MAQVLRGSFEIPEELAKELSTLLAKQTIKEHLLENIISDKDKFDEVESQLVPIIQKIDAIKNKITSEYVPEQYRSEKYSWNFDGYEVSGNLLQIYEIF